MKKSLSLFIALSLGVATLTGCGGGGDTKPAPKPEQGQETQKPSETETEKEVGITFPLEEQVELSFHYHARNKYVLKPEWPVFQELSKLTNVKLKNTANEVATNSVEQFQLEAVDGFPSDIYAGSNTLSYFMEYGPQGAFVSLSDNWEYLPHFRAYLDENPDVEAAITAPDGHVYHIPYIQGGQTAKTYFMRTDWLDTLNLEVPETVEELEEALMAFKTQDPNGNGLADEIPYFNDKWQEVLRLVNLWDARAYGMDTFEERVIPNEDGSVYHAWTQPEFKEAVKNISRWYDNGLIDQEIFTKGSASRKEYIPKDLGGMTHEWIASTATYNDMVDIPGFVFDVIAPPKSPKGNQWEEHERMKVKKDGTAVSSKSKNPEVALAFIDYFYSPEGRILTNFGVEGDTYTMVDGKPTFTEEVLNGDKTVLALLEEDKGAQLKLGFLQDYEYELQWTNDIALQGLDLYDNGGFQVSQMPTIVYNEQEKKVVDNVMTSLNDYMDETIQKWIMSDPSTVDKDWDKYIADLDKLGMKELIDAYQTAYTRYMDQIK